MVNCRDNFTAAAATWDFGWKDMPYPVKRVYELSRRARWFLLDRSKVKAGEYIDFKAEMNVLAIFSNYSQTRKA
jgi:uncharacterized protein YcgI (DUF1989 family)